MSCSIAQLTGAVGAPAVAARLLQAKTFNVDAEDFFVAHLADLWWRELLAWLSRPDPREERSRPIQRIASRIAETYGDPDDALAFMHAERLLGAVHDSAVRDEMLEALRPRVHAELWFRLTRLGGGGAVFAAVRDLEIRLENREARVPDGLLDDGPVPCLTMALFDARRSDDACLKVLGDALRPDGPRFYAVWVLRQLELLTRVGPPNVVLGDVLSSYEALLCPRNAFLLDVARGWPEPEARKAWWSRWAITAAARGVPWRCSWWEIPPELRDHVALESAATPAPAPWVVRTLAERVRTSPDLEALLAFLEGNPPEDVRGGNATPSSLFVRHALGRSPADDEVRDSAEACDSRSWPAWLASVSLPADLTDEAEARYLDLAVLPPALVIDRLLTLPATAARARRIVRLALSSGLLWTLERRHELVAAAGTMDAVPIPPRLTEDAVALFRALARDGAELALASHLEARLDRRDVVGALSVARAAPSIVSDEVRSTMRQLARALPISALALLHAEHPWFVSKDEVIAEALREERDDWGQADALPVFLTPAIEAKAVQTRVPELAAALLERLETLGASRRQVLGVALERLERHGSDALSRRWLAGKLTTKALWDDPGTRIVARLLGRGDESGARAVAELSIDAALPDRADLPRSIHAALASCLIDLAARGLQERDDRLAKRGLTALAHMNAPSRLRDRVRALRQFTPGADVLELIEVNEGLLRRSAVQDVATIDAVNEALSALVGTRDH